MNISIPLKSNLYAQNNQQPINAGLTQSYNKQNVAFSGLKASVATKGTRNVLFASIAALGIAASALFGTFTGNNKIQQNQVNEQNGPITSIKVGDDVIYKIDSIESTANSLVYDMKIATKSGNTAHIKQTITQDKVNFELPTGNLGKGDLSLTLDETKSTADALHGDLLINTKSGNELKFPYTIKNAKKIALKLDSVDLLKLIKAARK